VYKRIYISKYKILKTYRPDPGFSIPNIYIHLSVDSDAINSDLGKVIQANQGT
jgi:hypothetical protein